MLAHSGLGPPTSIIHDDYGQHPYPQGNLVEATPHLRFPLPRWDHFVSSWQINQHNTSLPPTSHTWLIPYPAGQGRHWWLGGSFGESSTPWVRVVLSGLCYFGQTLGLGFSHCFTLWTLHCPQLHRAGNGKSSHLISYSIQGQKHQCSIPISFCKWRSGPSPVGPPTPQDFRKLLLPSQLAKWEMGWLPETQASSHDPPILVLASH